MSVFPWWASVLNANSWGLYTPDVLQKDVEFQIFWMQTCRATHTIRPHKMHSEKKCTQHQAMMWRNPDISQQERKESNSGSIQLSQGEFHALIQELKLHHGCFSFSTYFRMSVGQVWLLLEELRGREIFVSGVLRPLDTTLQPTGGGRR